jgi:hypothetical protein
MIIASVMILYKLIFKNKSSIIDYKVVEEDATYDDNSDEYYLKEYGLKDLSQEDKQKIRSWEIYGAYELILLMCKKNGDWSKLPVSKETREQFNEKDGILKDFEFDSIEIDPKTIGIYDYDPTPAQIILTKGNEKTRVYIDYSYSIDNGGICQIEIKDAIKILDENGNKLNEGFPFNEKYTLQNFETWTNVGLTDKYISNHGKELLNLFTHYSPLEYNPIAFDERKSKLNNHMAYFIVTSLLECKEREYEVYYKLDENNYLDDAYAVCIKERVLENDGKNRYGSANAFYKNSNIETDFYSDKFKKRLMEKGSYFPDIDLVDIDNDGEEVRIDYQGDYEYIDCLQMKNGTINSYYIKYIMNDNKQIDDVIVEKLPYENMSAKEVKELYLKDIGNKNN